MASAAERHGSSGGWARGMRNSWVKHWASQCRAALLSLRKVISCAFGSAMRTHTVLSAAGMGQMSVFDDTGLPLTSITLALMGSCRNEASFVTRHWESRHHKNCDQLRGGMGYWVPGGLCKSAYSGAAKQRK